MHNLSSITAYATYLQQHPEEAQALLKDLLISVTNFFRDKKAFEAIEKDILPRLLQNKTPGNALRIWVIGCATGEEAYSLAIMCAERTLNRADAPKVQIFATDIDDDAIQFARNGLYSLNDAADVSPERLRRYFTKEGDSYRIRREIREMILFANHNILKDPPFSHLDMISCRNMMIYLNNIAQERVLETMHFALEPGGFLFLGTSESIDGAVDLFIPVNREQHIFQSRAVVRRFLPVPESVPNFSHVNKMEPRVLQEPENRATARISYNDLHLQLLELYAPPSVVTNEEYDIVHLTEHAGKYLQIGGGEVTNNILKLIKPELRLELRTALYQAVQQRVNVEASGLKININGTTEVINIHVRPVLREENTVRGYLLVLFEPATGEKEPEQKIYTADEPVARQLEEELVRTKTQLRNHIEQQELQAEELKASNEELQAMNEELRSAVEELETSKEELQSINEELTTVNQELKIKVEETSISNNNFQNLINSTNIATIFLDRSMRINMFTPATREIFNMIPADYGRPISDITNKLNYPNLTADAEEVLDKLKIIEREIEAANGSSYLLRVLPYRTEEDRINGVVMTFINITERKKWEEALRQSEERIRLIIESAKDYAIFAIDADRKFVTWSPGAEVVFGYTEGEITGQSGDIIFTIEDREAGVPVQEAEKAAKEGSAENERWHLRKNGERFWGSGVTQPLLDRNGNLIGFVKIMRDLTERRQAEEAKAAELKNTQLLRNLGMETIAEDNIQVLYDKVIAAAIELTSADAGTIQLYDEESGDLIFIASQGLPKAISDRFYRVGAHSSTSCGIAMSTRKRALVEFDAPNVPDVDGSLRVHIENGFLSALSTPLFSRSGKFIGMISTHWREHKHRPAESELRYIDLLARQAADLIDQRHAAKTIRESEERKSFLLKLSDALRPVADPVKIQETVTCLTMDYFAADRCYYCEIVNNDCIIRRDTFKEGLPSVAGVYALDNVPILKNKINAGKPFIVEDVHTTDLTDEPLRQLCIQLQIISFIGIPVLKGGLPIGVFCIVQSKPRTWAGIEIELAEEVAERTWTAVERAKAEEALRESENRFRTLTDAVPQLIWTNDAQGKANFFNKRWYEYSGLSYEQSAVLGWQAIVHPGDAPASVERWQKALEKGEPFDTEYRLRRAGGIYRWHLGRNVPLHNESGEVLGWFGSGTDIQDLAVAQMSLRESEERNNAMVNQTSVGIVRLDADGNILFLNDKARSTFSFKAGNGEIKTIWDVTLPEDLEEHRRLFKRLITEGLPFQFEKKLKRANGGGTFWASVSMAPIKDEQGKPQSAVTVIVDITGRKQAEEALRETMERFQYAVQATRDVIWEIDFNRNHVWWSSMMHAILGYSQKEVQHSVAWYQSLIHPDDHERVTKTFKEAVESKESLWTDEFKYRQSKGEYIYVICRAFIIRDEAGTALRMIGAMQDITARRLAEEAVRKSEERLRVTMESATDYVIVTSDVNGNIENWNSGAERIFGWKAEEVIGKYGDFFYTPEDRTAGVPQEEMKTARTEGRATDERWHVRKNGDRIFMSGILAPIQNNGIFTGFVKVARDMTKQRQAEEALRISEERLRISLDAGELASWDWNMETNKIGWNEKHYQLLGLENDDKDQEPEDFLNRVYPEDLSYVKTQLMIAAGKTGIYEAEFRIVRKDNGEIRWMTGYGKIMERKGEIPTRMSGVMYDITERKEAQEQLQTAQNSLHTALEAAQMGVWDIDLATDAVTRSPRHDQLLGYDMFQEEWTHDKAKQHMVEEDKARFDAARQRMFETGIFELEARIQHADGNICWVQLYGRIFKNEKGEPSHAAGVIFDITDRKTVEQKKDEFIGIASHELKTPVTSIKAYTEILKEQFEEEGNEQSAAHLGKLNSQVDRLTGLIRDLLDATRISEGRLLLNETAFDINQVLRQTAEDLQRTTGRHQIELQLKDLPLFTGDKERLQQVFVNLIANAIKYSPEGDKVILRAYFENGNIHIEVEDFGIGMSAETQSKVFERFFRSSDSHIATFPGLGLGLYISMQLVKQHKGTIRVQSEKGKGSVFTVVLPVEGQAI